MQRDSKTYDLPLPESEIDLVLLQEHILKSPFRAIDVDMSHCVYVLFASIASPDLWTLLYKVPSVVDYKVLYRHEIFGFWQMLSLIQLVYPNFYDHLKEQFRLPPPDVEINVDQLRHYITDSHSRKMEFQKDSRAAIAFLAHKKNDEWFVGFRLFDGTHHSEEKSGISSALSYIRLTFPLFYARIKEQFPSEREQPCE